MERWNGMGSFVFERGGAPEWAARSAPSQATSRIFSALRRHDVPSGSSVSRGSDGTWRMASASGGKCE